MLNRFLINIKDEQDKFILRMYFRYYKVTLNSLNKDKLLKECEKTDLLRFPMHTGLKEKEDLLKSQKDFNKYILTLLNHQLNIKYYFFYKNRPNKFCYLTITNNIVITYYLLIVQKKINKQIIFNNLLAIYNFISKLQLRKKLLRRISYAIFRRIFEIWYILKINVYQIQNTDIFNRYFKYCENANYIPPYQMHNNEIIYYDIPISSGTIQDIVYCINMTKLKIKILLSNAERINNKITLNPHQKNQLRELKSQLLLLKKQKLILIPKKDTDESKKTK